MTDLMVATDDAPDLPVVQQIVEQLREAGVLGNTYADFSQGLICPDDSEESLERMRSMGRFIAAAYNASRWWIADYLIFVEGAFGERSADIADSIGLSPETLTDYVRVAMRIPRSRRRTELHFGHHRVVASMKPEEQDAYLAKAVKKGYSTRDLTEQVKKDKAKKQDAEEHPDVEARIVLPRHIELIRRAMAESIAEDQWIKIPRETWAQLVAIAGD